MDDDLTILTEICSEHTKMLLAALNARDEERIRDAHSEYMETSRKWSELFSEIYAASGIVRHPVEELKR